METADAGNFFPDGPPPVSAAEAAAIAKSIEAAERRLAPADRKGRIAHVAQLLQHFFMPDLPPSAWRALYADWALVLEEYPESMIRNACLHWLKHKTHRPLPAAIRALCDDALRRERRIIESLREIVETHHADPTWRWLEGDPEPPAVWDIQCQRRWIDAKNMMALHRAFDLVRHNFPTPYSADEAASYHGKTIEVGQVVGWNQSETDAMVRAERILREAASKYQLGIDSVETDTDGSDSEGIIRVYAIGTIAGLTKHPDDFKGDYDPDNFDFS